MRLLFIETSIEKHPFIKIDLYRVKRKGLRRLASGWCEPEGKALYRQFLAFVGLHPKTLGRSFRGEMQRKAGGILGRKQISQIDTVEIVMPDLTQEARERGPVMEIFNHRDDIPFLKGEIYSLKIKEA